MTPYEDLIRGWTNYHWHVVSKDTLENLIALHPNCHRQVHSKLTDKLVS
ncbi:MAG: HNH endonuclease [Alkaliphilus sp.]